MGAVTAASVTINNYLTHKNVADLKEELQKALDECNAKPEGCSTDDQLSIMQGLINKYQQISTTTTGRLLRSAPQRNALKLFLTKIWRPLESCSRFLEAIGQNFYNI